MAVVDASVVVKWFARESYSDKANLLKEAYVKGLIDLSAPCILPFEVLNALKYTYHLGQRELLEVSQALEDFQFDLRSLYEVKEEVAEISSVYGVTIYDAAYVALGKRLNEVVYTADEKLLARLKGVEFVRHIRDFSV